MDDHESCHIEQLHAQYAHTFDYIQYNLPFEYHVWMNGSKHKTHNV